MIDGWRSFRTHALTHSLTHSLTLIAGFAARAFWDADRINGVAAPDARAINFYLAVPPEPTPMPTQGYPVVIGSHGLTGHGSQIYGDAAGFAANGGVPMSWVATSAVRCEPGGWPCARIVLDAVDIGPQIGDTPGTCAGSLIPCTAANEASRCSGSQGVCVEEEQTQIDLFQEPPPTVCEADEECVSGSRCVRCLRVSIDLPRVRDNFRQTIADFVQLTTMLQHAAALPEPTPPFDRMDPSRLFYSGGSLGGILGALYLGVQPDVQAAVLGVPGGGFLYLLESATGRDIESIFLGVFGLSASDPAVQHVLHGARQLAQWGLDAADPINYARGVRPGRPATPGGTPTPKRVLLLDGIVDSVIPNRMKDELALAMSLPDVKASHGCEVPDACGGCSGIWRYVMSEYPGSQEGHGLDADEARRQWVEYLNSAGTVITDGDRVTCCQGADSCTAPYPVNCASGTPVTRAACVADVCLPFTPTPTPEPGEDDCCQQDDPEWACAAPVEGICVDATPVFGAACEVDGSCVHPTATPTPGPSDCCQGEGVCGVPRDGGGCVDGEPLYNAVCVVDGEEGTCVEPAATPAPGGGDCCQLIEWSTEEGIVHTCTAPAEGACPFGTPIVNASCLEGVRCATPTPTPTLGPNDCCQAAEACAAPEDGDCGEASGVYDAVCVADACATPTPGPEDCCQGESACVTPEENQSCPGGMTGVYRAACDEFEADCVPFTPTPTPLPTATAPCN